MKQRIRSFAILLILFFVPYAWSGDSIPKAAWKRAIGAPLPNAGTRKPNLTDLIDDGYWQGAPVGGFGSGTFSRTYRGDFSRWHLKTGVHKYETVDVNQFAMFQKSEGAPAGIAQVLAATAAVDVLERQLGKTILRAPADGVVQLIVAEVGEAVRAGEPVLTLEEAGKRWLSFNIREDQLHGITVGDRVNVQAAELSAPVSARISELLLNVAASRSLRIHRLVQPDG